MPPSGNTPIWPLAASPVVANACFVAVCAAHQTVWQTPTYTERWLVGLVLFFAAAAGSALVLGGLGMLWLLTHRDWRRAAWGLAAWFVAFGLFLLGIRLDAATILYLT